ALNVVGVGVRGDDHLAGGQVEVHGADEVDDLREGVEPADVDEQELGAAVDEIDVDPQAPAGLVVQLDHVRKEVLPLAHDGFTIDGDFTRTGFRDTGNGRAAPFPPRRGCP